MDEPVTSVVVECGSRLHFGLLAPSQAPDGRSFGGVGLMICEPRTKVCLGPGDRLAVSGPQAERVERTVARWCEARGAEQPHVNIEVLESAASHVGWGSGTQLALATVAALEAFAGRGVPDAQRLAEWSGRGQRSAVGVHGFLLGGLIVEWGKRPGEAVAPLKERIALPDAWRVVLLTPTDSRDLVHGERERQAFGQLAAADEAIGWQRDLVERRLSPAARAGDFPRFSEALGEFNRQSGAFFAGVQGGPYASPWHRRQVEWLAERGALGAGQSSWGPTMFALADSARAADRLTAEWRAASGRAADVRVASPRNRGASVRVGRAAGGVSANSSD
jgi:beta-RFAP synthase